MQDQHITNARLANDVDISVGLISFYRNDKQKPGAEILARLADYFNVSVDYLLGRTDVPNMQAMPPSGSSDEAESISEEEIMIDFEELKAIMKVQGIKSFAALETRAGLSHGLISNWKSGRFKPILENVEKIGVALGVPIDSFLVSTETDVPITVAANLGGSRYDKLSPTQRDEVDRFIAYVIDQTEKAAKAQRKRKPPDEE
jgi:transcriptional regulator with XRE-family HTH domain